MIRCAVSRCSSSAKLLTATGRAHISTAKPPAFDDLERDHGISDPSYTSQPIDPRTEKGHVQTTAGETGHGTQQSPSATKPVRRRELPISPYMDPTTISAKEKHRTAKPPPSKDPTAFQKLIAKNPYVLAIASPVRTCRVTAITLPRYFFQDFNLMLHPETKEPWWVPRSLARNPSHHSLEDEHADGERHISLGEGATDNGELSEEEFNISDLEVDNITLDEPKSAIDSPSEKLPPSSTSIGPYAYVLAREPLLKQFSNEALGNEPHGHRSMQLHTLESMYPPRSRDQGPLRDVLRTAKVRSDIDTFVLELMRRRAVEELEHLLKLKVYIQPSVSWKDATRASRQVGAILWTGSVRGEPSQSDVEKAPPEFATIDIGTTKRKTPVHNLEKLLGGEHLQKLKDKFGLFEKKLLVVRHKNMTVGIQMKLWKLQGFLAEYRDLETDHPETENQPLVGKDEEEMDQETAEITRGDH